jgi:hypothetical protein
MATSITRASMISRRLRSCCWQADDGEDFGRFGIVHVWGLNRYDSGGYAESTVSPKFFAICGYLAISLKKFRRAREAGQCGNADGCRPINAHRCIFLASKCWRSWGRACILIFLRKLAGNSAVNQGSAQLNSELLFPVMMAI